MNLHLNVSGFTFIKNGITLGYPFIESIKSIAPLCDEVIINVGFDQPECQKDDGTFNLLRETFSDKKFVFLKSYWNPCLVSGGMVLSEQTNIALTRCRGKYCHYIQGDEIVHEDDFGLIQKGIKHMEQDSSIDGLVYNFIHFYGNPGIVKQTRNTYRREIRLIRNHCNIKSWKDAQGFRHNNDTKLKVCLIPARIFHYGWARQEATMDKKNKSFAKLYHGNKHQEEDFFYKHIWGLRPFTKTHPKVMRDWVEQHKSSRDILSEPLVFEWKNIGLAVSDWIESFSGYRLGEYKNYKLKDRLSR